MNEQIGGTVPVPEGTEQVSAVGDECPSCGCTDLIGVEYAYGSPNRYDGVSEWRCPDCGTRTGRWTGRVLGEGESELRYGGSA